jgi:phosphodiesterase/alkaline phosphatase D-like protein
MNKILKWVIVLVVLTIAFASSGYAAVGTVSPVYLEQPDSQREITSEPVGRQSPAAYDLSEVIQNKAYAKLNIESGMANIAAGFIHPDNLEEEVMIEWALYGWNAGDIDPVVLRENIREIGIGQTEVVSQVSVLEDDYDYYFLECRNKTLDDEGEFIGRFTTESRYSKIAPMNGTWERTGEVTSSSAILQTYLTEKPPFDATDADSLRVPPMAGFAQFIVYRDPELTDKVTESGFYPVDDYIQVNSEWRRIYYNFRWTVTGLEPDTEYYYLVETKSSDQLDSRLATNVNTFRTAPLIDAVEPISFVLAHSLDISNTAYADPAIGADLGLKTFDSMLNYAELPPDFIIMQGDTVIYDGGNGFAPYVGMDPNSEYTRRWLYWNATYQFDNFMNFYQQVPGYWMVDDHDYWVNNINETRPDGWYIFRNINPTPGSYGTTGEDGVDYYDSNPYLTSKGDGSNYWRAIRWGQLLEIFIEEGRNHRDENAGLIWGEEQRVWLEQRILESEAIFKIIVTSTPILGPVVPDDFDPTLIPDKHANQKFRAETELFLNNIKDVDNVFIAAGDRHFKYHSIVNVSNFPELSNFNEFSAGSAAAPPHATRGGEPDTDLAIKVFSDGLHGSGPSAGYMRVEVIPTERGAQITFKLIAVTQDLDNDVVYQQTYTYSNPPAYILYMPVVLSQPYR